MDKYLHPLWYRWFNYLYRFWTELISLPDREHWIMMKISIWLRLQEFLSVACFTTFNIRVEKKIVTILQRTFSKSSFWMCTCHFDIEFHLYISLFTNWQRASIGSRYDIARNGHYLNQWCYSLLTHICVTRPEWVQDISCSLVNPRLKLGHG